MLLCLWYFGFYPIARLAVAPVGVVKLCGAVGILFFEAFGFDKLKGAADDYLGALEEGVGYGLSALPGIAHGFVDAVEEELDDVLFVDAYLFEVFGDEVEAGCFWVLSPDAFGGDELAGDVFLSYVEVLAGVAA